MFAASVSKFESSIASQSKPVSPERVGRHLLGAFITLMAVAVACFLMAGCPPAPVLFGAVAVAGLAFAPKLKTLASGFHYSLAAVVNGMLFAVFAIGLVSGCAATPAHAQSVSNLYMGGVSYQPKASPAVAGTALYAHQLNFSPDTYAGGTYAFTVIDAVPTNDKPFTVTTNIGAGIAQKIATIDGVDILIPTSAGISWSGTNTGWAWSTGAGAPIKIKAASGGCGWYVMPSVRVVKSSISNGTGYQPIFGLLVGWGG